MAKGKSNVPAVRGVKGCEPVAGRDIVPVPSAQKIAPYAASAGEPMILGGRDAALVIGHAYRTSAGVIHADEIYFVRDIHPRGDGPWLGEADKVSWRDPATGYECIMMRATQGGYLQGFVGVPADHPLYGYECDAIPASLGFDVHGGLDYSAVCEEGPSPDPRYVPKGGVARQSRRICHSPPQEMVRVEITHATAYRAHDDAWWLGFSCNHAYDVVPKDARHQTGFLSRETGQEYRDDGYVLREVRFLAAQLRAIHDDAPLPVRVGEGPPAMGLDPDRGR